MTQKSNKRKCTLPNLAIFSFSSRLNDSPRLIILSMQKLPNLIYRGVDLNRNFGFSWGGSGFIEFQVWYILLIKYVHLFVYNTITYEQVYLTCISTELQEFIIPDIRQKWFQIPYITKRLLILMSYSYCLISLKCVCYIQVCKYWTPAHNFIEDDPRIIPP